MLSKGSLQVAVYHVLIFLKEAEIRTDENSLLFIRVGIFTGKENPLAKPKGAKKDGKRSFF